MKEVKGFRVGDRVKVPHVVWVGTVRAFWLMGSGYYMAKIMWDNCAVTSERVERLARQ